MSHLTSPLHSQPAPPTLTLLPSELLLKIFSHLDPGSSACLGLTCKRLYLLHRSLHGSVRLETRCHTALSPAPGPKLYEMLEEWYGPGFEMCWCGHSRVKTARVGPFYFPFYLRKDVGEGWGEHCADFSRSSAGWSLKRAGRMGGVLNVGLRYFRSRSSG
jgi:hypothetical protein